MTAPKLIKMTRSRPWKPEGAKVFQSIERVLAFKKAAGYTPCPIVLICDRRNVVFGNFVGKSGATKYLQAHIFGRWFWGSFYCEQFPYQYRALRDALPLLEHVDYLACWCADWEYRQEPEPDCHCVTIINAYMEATA